MSLNKAFFKLAIPNVLANLAIPLMSFTDTALMGHEESPYLLGAVAISAQIFNCIYWIFGFLRMGTTGMTAQACGAKEGEGLIFYRSIFCALIIAVCLLVLQVLIARVTFHVLDLEPSLELAAKSYFDIRIFAAPATLLLYSFIGWFLGMQNSLCPMLLSYCSAGFNVLISYVLVRHYGMGVEGVAWGTLISQYLSLCCGIFLLRKYKNKLKRPLLSEVLHWRELKVFLSVNKDLFIRTAFLLAVVSSFTFMGKNYSPEILAANAILVNITACLAYLVDGYAFAAESLTGKYVGQRNFDTLKKMIGLCFKWGMISGLLTACVLLLFSSQIFNIFTTQELIIEQAHIYLPWLIVACLINPPAFILDGVFVGLGEAAKMKKIIVQCSLLFYLPILYFMWQKGNHYLWFAMSLFMLMRSVLMLLEFKKINLLER